MVEPSSDTKAAQAQQALEALGFRRCRVWDHGAVSRIEIAPEERARMHRPELWDEIVRRVRAAGFAYVTLDLPGAPVDPKPTETEDTSS